MIDNNNLSGEDKSKIIGIESNYIVEDSNGDKYPIFTTNSNSCYIIKTSQKTGKQYKYFLPIEVYVIINEESKHNKE